MPRGLFFETVISPHYTFEILAWLAFIFYTSSISTLIFIVLGTNYMYKAARVQKKKLLALKISEELKDLVS